MCKLDMYHTHDPGTINRTEGAPAANKLFMPEPTARYNAGIHTVDLFTDVVLV